MHAQLFYPLPGFLPSDTHLPLFYALVAVGPSLSSLSCLLASVFKTASIASSMGSPLRSARAFAWRIKTSLAISATV